MTSELTITKPDARRMELRARLLTVRSVDRIKLIFPDESTGRVRLPDVSADRLFGAGAERLARGGCGGRSMIRDYTLALKPAAARGYAEYLCVSDLTAWPAPRR